MIAISLLVARDFSCPIVYVRQRHAAPAAAVPVPLTAVHKDDGLSGWKNDIRFARQTRGVDSIPQSSREQGFSQAKLRHRVLTAHAGHDAATRRLIELVGHSEVLFRCGLRQCTRMRLKPLIRPPLDAFKALPRPLR